MLRTGMKFRLGDLEYTITAIRGRKVHTVGSDNQQYVFYRDIAASLVSRHSGYEAGQQGLPLNIPAAVYDPIAYEMGWNQGRR